MLKNLRVRTKLIALLAVPLAGLIVMATIGVLDRQADAAEARDGRKLAELTSARVVRSPTAPRRRSQPRRTTPVA